MLISIVREIVYILHKGALLLPEMAIALLESTLPLWLIENMQPHKWQLGMLLQLSTIIKTTS